MFIGEVLIHGDPNIQGAIHAESGSGRASPLGYRGSLSAQEMFLKLPCMHLHAIRLKNYCKTL